jgi:drug/metabolite transporter (DMT)-like permease
MTPLVLALVAAGAIAHAAWNLTIKRARTSGAGFLWLTFVVGAVVFAPFGVWALAAEGVDLWRWAGFALGSGALQVGYFLLLQKGYSVGDVSVVYPLARGTGPLLAVVLAIVLLGERPGWAVLLGAAIVVAGVVTIGLAGGRAGGRASRAGVLFGLLIGVLIAGYTLWDATAVTVGALPVVGLYWGSLVVQVALLAPWALRDRQLRATAIAHRGAVLTVGVLAPLAYILILLAIQLAPVSVVAPAREVSVVLVSLAGWLWFREPHPAQRLAGAAVVLLGVGVLTVG